MLGISITTKSGRTTNGSYLKNPNQTSSKSIPPVWIILRQDQEDRHVLRKTGHRQKRNMTCSEQGHTVESPADSGTTLPRPFAGWLLTSKQQSVRRKQIWRTRRRFVCVPAQSQLDVAQRQNWWGLDLFIGWCTQLKNMAPNPEFCRVCLKANINQKARWKTQALCELLLHPTSTCSLFICPKLVKSFTKCCWGSAPHVRPHALVDANSCSTCTTPCIKTQPDLSPPAIANIQENSNQYAWSFIFLLRIISHIGFWLLRTVQDGWLLLRLNRIRCIRPGEEKVTLEALLLMSVYTLHQQISSFLITLSSHLHKIRIKIIVQFTPRIHDQAMSFPHSQETIQNYKQLGHII